MQIVLGAQSSEAWLEAVLSDFDSFLIDHAANERKASSMAMSLVAHYPDRQALVSAMIDLALEELNHFRQVMKLLQDRNIVMTPDEKDPYVNQIRQHVRSGSEDYFLDRLLSAAIIEARGEERFRLIANALDDPKLQGFYTTIANSEQGHHKLFIDLAQNYFDKQTIEDRVNDWIAIEGSILRSLTPRPRLH